MTRMESDKAWFAELSAEDRSWVGHDRPGRHPGLRHVVPRPRRLPHRGHRRRLGDRRPGVRRRSAGAGRRDQPPADRRAGPADHRRRRGEHRRAARPPAGPHRARRGCCATAASWRSRPPRSTPAPPRSAAPGTPGSRRWSSTRCSAPTADDDRALPRRRPRLGRPRPGGRGARRGAGLAAPRPPCSTTYARSARAAGSTRCAPPRATGWSSSSAGWRTPSAPPSAVAAPLRRRDRSCTGPLAADLAEAHRSAARGRCPGVPRGAGLAGRPAPGAADDLLPERALAGDADARQQLVRRSTCRCCTPRAPLIETLDGATSSHGASIEGAARVLFVHPNTVRYRLRQVGERHRAHPDPAAGRVHGRDRARAGPAGRRRGDRAVTIL